jgi:hypothetical protein
VQRDFASTKLVKLFKFAAKLQSPPCPPTPNPCFAASPPRRPHCRSCVCVFQVYFLDRLHYTSWSRRVTSLDVTSWLLISFKSYSLLNTCYYLWSRSMNIVFQTHIISVMQLMIASTNWMLCYIWTEPVVLYGDLDRRKISPHRDSIPGPSSS